MQSDEWAAHDARRARLAGIMRPSKQRRALIKEPGVHKDMPQGLRTERNDLRAPAGVERLI